MKVLVTAASKHGSTHEIGEAIAMQIQALGIPAEFCDLDSPMRHIEASAVVLGSPIYMGKWLPEAQRLRREAPGPAQGSAGLALQQRTARRRS